MFIEEGLEQMFRAFFQFLNNVRSGAATAVQLPIGAFQVLDAFRRKFLGMETQGMKIEPSVTNGIPGCLCAGRNIAVHLVGPANEGVGTDLISLLDGRNPTDGRKFPYADVTTKLAAIGYNYPTAYIAVMTYM